MMFLEMKMLQDGWRLMQLQGKLQKSVKITYLEENKQQTRYRLT